MERAPSQAEAVADSTKVVEDIEDADVIVLEYYYDTKCFLKTRSESILLCNYVLYALPAVISF